MFQVVRGSGGTQPDGGNVLLRVILEFLNPFRGLARTDYHNPRSKRVEVPAWPTFNFFSFIRRQMW